MHDSNYARRMRGLALLVLSLVGCTRIDESCRATATCPYEPQEAGAASATASATATAPPALAAPDTSASANPSANVGADVTPAPTPSDSSNAVDLSVLPTPLPVDAKPVGEVCAVDDDCELGFCTDGFCCESRCGLDCDRCDAPGQEGSCVTSTDGVCGDCLEPDCSPDEAITDEAPGEMGVDDTPPDTSVSDQDAGPLPPAAPSTSTEPTPNPSLDSGSPAPVPTETPVACPDCECEAGESRSCGSNQGNCEEGTQYCEDGSWGECEGGIQPELTDSCDVEGDDANCDGTVNDGCECINGETQPCGTDIGNCELGQETCVAGQWGECEGGVDAQSQDSCELHGDDANCNGVVNEGCPCVADEVGACNECGQRQCNPAARDWGACSPVFEGARRCSPTGGGLDTCIGTGFWEPSGDGRECPDICFPSPIAVPGLSGAPEWDPDSGAAVVRSDLLDPRWGAAAATEFASDPGGNASYRMVLDNDRERLSVSVLAHDDPQGLDAVFFAATNDEAGSVGRAFAIDPPPGGTTTLESAFVPIGWSRSGGVWTPTVSPGPDVFGFDAPFAWSSPTEPGIEWAVNFHVKLTTIGANTGSNFRFFLGMQTSNETPQSTPDSTLDQHIAGTIIPDDPTTWATAALDVICDNQIGIDGASIGTTQADPSQVDTASGEQNTFFAQPSYPDGVPPTGSIRGRFRLATWGSVADPQAAWPIIPGGEAVPNDNPTGRMEFSCPVNTASTVCGLDMPAELSQSLMVELFSTPGQDYFFSSAAAHRNMQFVTLSEASRNARIDVRGLQGKLGNSKPRDVYLRVEQRNMPEHGSAPLWLPAHAMELQRRTVERRGKVGPTKLNNRTRSTSPLPAPLDHRRSMSLWPSYVIHAYYDTGRLRVVDGKARKQLRAMPSFGYFLQHDGPFYGFGHRLEGLAGAQLEALDDGWYKLTIENESHADIRTTFIAHEEPKALGSASYQQLVALTNAPPAAASKRGTLSLPGTLWPLELAAGGFGLALWLRRRTR